MNITDLQIIKIMQVNAQQVDNDKTMYTSKGYRPSQTSHANNALMPSCRGSQQLSVHSSPN